MKYLFVLAFLISPSNIFGQSKSVISETRPEFPGGKTALNTYLNKNFKYPTSARKSGYCGKLIVTFTVGTDGKTTVKNINNRAMVFEEAKKETLNSKIMTDSLTFKKVQDSLRNQAVLDVKSEVTRLIEAMPDWKPATRNGKKMIAYMFLPYNLELY